MTGKPTKKFEQIIYSPAGPCFHFLTAGIQLNHYHVHVLQPRCVNLHLYIKIKMSLLQSFRNRPLTYYVILNYLISWSFLYPAYQAILNAEDGTFPLLALLGIPGGFGPTIAAIIVIRLTEGKQALYQLLRKYKKFKVHSKWYFFVLIVPLVLYLISLLATAIFGFEFFLR